MTKTEKRIKFFEFFTVLTGFAMRSNISFLVTCYKRSDHEQWMKYLEGTSKCDGMSKRSAHQDWLAIDIVIVVDGKLQWARNDAYEALGTEWKSMGGIWGGDWQSLNDIYHFQWGDNLVQDTD